MATLSRRSFIKSALAASTLPIMAQATSTKPSQVLRFIHVTDSHMDVSDGDSVEALELMVTHVNKNYKDLDFVLFGGDNFNNNAPENNDALKFKEIIEKLHCSAYVIRGNKESSPTNDARIDNKEFKSMFFDKKEFVISQNDWRFEKKGYLILGLDSCIDGANNGRYTSETLSFAETALQEGKPTLILNHHPYTNYWKGTEEKDIHKYVLNNSEQTQKMLFGHNNLLLTLSGHKHIDSVSKIGDVTAIVTRGFIRPLDLDQYPMRYIELTDNVIHEKLIYTE